MSSVFAETRHTLEEDVAVGEQRDHQALDDVLVAEDSFGNFSAEFLRPNGTGDHGMRWKNREWGR